MPDRRDPERPREIAERASHCHAEFEAGRMSVSLYRGYLYSFGLRGRAIETEINLHWPTRSQQ